MKKLRESILYWKIVFLYTFVFVCLLCMSGCSSLISSDEQMRRFEQAGPITPEVDIDGLLRAKIYTGYYRVVVGDILKLRMPAVLRIVSPDLSKWFEPVPGHYDIEPYLFRVSEAGSITLPIVGEMLVAGRKLTEIEILIVNAYYPKYVANLPSVVCEVKEYQTEKITVIGGVTDPGLYRLRSDEMSLVAALMKAGGIIEEGASLITIQHADSFVEDEALQANDSSNREERIITSRLDKVLRYADTNIKDEKKREAFIKNLVELHRNSQNDDIEQTLRQLEEKAVDVSSSKSRPIVLPVKGLNIPFADVTLRAGDVIEIKKLNPEVFTVLGPVKSPGAFPYPHDTQYNLMQALAFAGGPDLILNPRYVTIYRQDSNGQIVSATFGLDRRFLAKTSTIKIEPGDVISVEMTAATRARIILREMLSIRFDYDLDELM